MEEELSIEIESRRRRIFFVPKNAFSPKISLFSCLRLCLKEKQISKAEIFL